MGASGSKSSGSLACSEGKSEVSLEGTAAGPLSGCASEECGSGFMLPSPSLGLGCAAFKPREKVGVADAHASARNPSAPRATALAAQPLQRACRKAGQVGRLSVIEDLGL